MKQRFRKTRASRPQVSRPRLGVGLTLAAVTVAAAAPGWAQVSAPMSFRQSITPPSAVHQLEMAPVDVDSLRAEDLIRDSAVTPGPIRFAAPIKVKYTTENAGTWEVLADGSGLWRLRIASPGALSLNLGFEHFDLPPGASLWIYDPGGQRIEGPYTWRDRNSAGGLWTPIIEGAEIMLELHLPNAAVKARLEVSAVNHGYRFFGEGARKQGDCNIDVICPEVDPYRDLVRSVARYTVSGFTLCTGQLVNNTALDFRPFFLTAQHCGVNPATASSLVVYWNFESPTCGQLSGGSLADNQSGATYRADDFPTDFTLVELDQVPDTASNVYYAGWDAGGATPQSVVVIHHPAGDEKAAAFEGDPLVDADIGRGGATHWEVTAWDLGTTEPGSSGACIFDQSNMGCVGWLTGGTAACTVPDGFDVFGKLSLAWTGAGTDDTRLSNWLDPVGGGATTFLEGADPADGGGGDDDDDGGGGDDDDDDGGGDDDDDDGGGEPQPGDCTPGSTTMCLYNDRFEAQVDWSDFLGASGAGIVSPAGDDYFGVFWFFAPMNGEVLVKVLDGCDINDHYWVFVAAATNVGYDLTVTDTATGASRTYQNSLGQTPDAVLDTTAFATCP